MARALPAAQAEIAITAARLVAEQGMAYAQAKRRAAAALGHGRGVELPSDEALEDALREELALFHADTQPRELAALRRLALSWMQRLAALRPHLGGAVWRGTATRHSALLIDLYCDDPKTAEIALINLGVRYDSAPSQPGGADAAPVLVAHARLDELALEVPVQLTLHDLNRQRGALRPDARGRSWRGDLGALQRLLADDAAAAADPADASVDTAGAASPSKGRAP